MGGTFLRPSLVSRHRSMRRIPDIIIAVGVIVGAVSISIGFRVVGIISLAIALLVGWKRDWANDLFEGMMSSSEGSAVNDMHDSHLDHVGDVGHGGDADGEH